MGISLKNLYLALKDQLPAKRLLKNVLTGNIGGIFSKHSHTNKSGTPKVMYNTKVSACKAALAMQKKHNVRFDAYKCVYCTGYHIGKNAGKNNDKV